MPKLKPSFSLPPVTGNPLAGAESAAPVGAVKEAGTAPIAEVNNETVPRDSFRKAGAASMGQRGSDGRFSQAEFSRKFYGKGGPVDATVFWIGSRELGDAYHVKAALALHHSYQFRVLLSVDKDGQPDQSGQTQWSRHLTGLLGEDRCAGSPIVATEAEMSAIKERFLHPVQATAMVGHAFSTQPACRVSEFIRGQMLSTASDMDRQRATEQLHRLAARGGAKQLLNKSVQKALIWVRADPSYQVHRNSTQQLLDDLVSQSLKDGLLPVVAGPRAIVEASPTTPGAFATPQPRDFRLPAGAIDMTEHWKDANGDAMTPTQQTALVDELISHGVTKQVGMKSGGMDLGAMLGLQTDWFSVDDVKTGQPCEHRMEMWGDVPGYTMEHLPKYAAKHGQGLIAKQSVLHLLIDQKRSSSR